MPLLLFQVTKPAWSKVEMTENDTTLNAIDFFSPCAVSSTVWTMGSDEKRGLSGDSDGTWGWLRPLWQRHDAPHNKAVRSAVQRVLLET